MEVAGVQGFTYELGTWNAGQLSRVEGAVWNKGVGGRGQVRVHLPAANERSSIGGGGRSSKDSETYVRQKVVFYFAGK
jgi:hypothetical protein